LTLTSVLPSSLNETRLSEACGRPHFPWLQTSVYSLFFRVSGQLPGLAGTPYRATGQHSTALSGSTGCPCTRGPACSRTKVFGSDSACAPARQHLPQPGHRLLYATQVPGFGGGTR